VFGLVADAALVRPTAGAVAEAAKTVIPTFAQSLSEHFTACHFILNYEDRVHKLPP